MNVRSLFNQASGLGRSGASSRTGGARALLLAMPLHLLLATGNAAAQASLASEDRIDEIPVTVNGVEEAFSVVRDARLAEQWYYMPDQPRLFERTVAGRTEPEFTLIRYQFRDASNPQEVLEGGVLQFAVSLALPPQALPQLEAAIRQKVGGDKPIRLAAMPFREATVALYNPSDGTLVGTGGHTGGIAPVFSTQKMVFSVPLTRIGSDVYDALVNGNTGIGVAVELSFNGLEPPAGVRVSIDWDRVYEFYSRRDKAAAEASFLGFFGAKAAADRQRVRETLESNKCIEIEVTEGENLPAEKLDSIVQGLLARANAELLTDLAPPKAIETDDPAPTDEAGKKKAREDQPRGWLDQLDFKRKLKVGYSLELKDIKQVKRGKERLEFTARSLMTRKTLAAGFVGIGRYPQDVREKLVTVVPEGPWKTAFFVLPPVGDSEDLGIRHVDLEIGLTDGRETRQSQVVVWTPESGWKDRRGTPRTVLTFPLMGLDASGFSLERARFQSSAEIAVGREVLRLEQTHDVFDGETRVIKPLESVDVVAVDGSLLSWTRVVPDSTLVAANVTLRSGERSVTSRLRPRNVNGTWTEPQPLYWMIPKGSPPVTAEIRFLLDDGRTLEWRHNGQDLQRTLSSLEVTLTDGDWRTRSGS